MSPGHREHKLFQVRERFGVEIARHTGIRPRRIMKIRAVSVALGASALFSADAFMKTPAALRPTLRAATRPVSFNGEPLLRHSSASLCLCGAVDRC